jgi:hypothetical protein
MAMSNEEKPFIFYFFFLIVTRRIFETIYVQLYDKDIKTTAVIILRSKYEHIKH